MTEVFSFEQLYTAVRGLRGQHVIVRFEYSLFVLASIIFLLLRGIRPIIYTQDPVENAGQSLQFSRRLRRAAQSVFRLHEITPVSIDRPSMALREAHRTRTFIPFCVDQGEPVVTRGTAREAKEACRVVSIGKFQRRKRHVEVVKAIAKLREETGLEVQLTIVGEVTTSEHLSYLNEVRAAIDNLAMNDYTSTLLNLSPEKTQDVLSQSDVFVLYSHCEPASVSQVEALAYGLPVVIGRDNGTANYIEHGVTGYTVTISEDLQSSLARLVAHAELRERMSGDAVESHKRFYSFEPNVTLWNSFLTSREK